MESNAALSANAKQLTEHAHETTIQADRGNATHAQAAQAHRDAAYANHRAGNTTLARKHEAQAQLHDEAAVPQRAAEGFAKQLGAHADRLSKKADMATAAGDGHAQLNEHSEDKDPRTAKELHRAASIAHGNAANAFKIADCPDKAAYHEGKQVEHDSKMTAREEA